MSTSHKTLVHLITVVCFAEKPKYKGTAFTTDVVKPKGTLEEQLFEAVQSGDYDEVKDVLAKGANVNHVQDGWSALMFAALYSHFNILKLILENGGDAKFHRDFNTPIMAICNGGVRSQDEDDRCECVRLLVERGADVNDSDRHRNTALMMAAEVGHAKLVKQLLDLGARVNVLDKDRATALMHAVKYNRNNVVDVLLKAKADFRVRDRHNNSAYDYAVIKGNETLAGKLQFDFMKTSTSKNVNVKKSFILEELLEEMPSRNRGGNLAGFPSDLYELLCGMDEQYSAYVFYDNKIQLGEFLLMTDEKLKLLGVKLSFHRRRILESIKSFHLHRWSASSFCCKRNTEKFDSMDCIRMVAALVRQLHVMQSSLLYLEQHLSDEGLHDEALQILNKAAHEAQLLGSECHDIGQFAAALDKRQKIVPADLIEAKTKDRSKKVIVIHGLWLCAVGVVAWKRKGFLINSLHKISHVFN
ncbi:ankyrin repeat, SAM and basic leucine zipper domain-containing protein 1-like [Nilaparvata lugens]|uniref:ankyrin repeat, SAM and basic leucine zipper domain-containing protein 1-like n=1 Tax=Nilaparvata lugens TaxID=108931 RepID=UPI00193D72BB|nr:ankyrin repeat, SAM and basic leucine zipper domain-containing protein 1-like [Nilaparvata lugens]